jgi:hypothetical protein
MRQRVSSYHPVTKRDNSAIDRNQTAAAATKRFEIVVRDRKHGGAEEFPD